MIHKAGKPASEVSSYRPISLLPILSKVFEKCLLQKIQPYIEDKNIIPNHQFGFRRNHSTIQQVHRVTSVIYNSFEVGNYCNAIFLDVSQAFDKVFHTGLAFKIRRLLPVETHGTLLSYLSNRKFVVKYKNATSEEKDVNAGVPQGSVLGPLLYLIYTADLPTHKNLFISTFADDTAIISSQPDPKDASDLMSTYIERLEIWLKTWRIHVNESKSTQVTFTLNRETCPALKLNGVTIPQAKTAKYLGMTLDNRMTWNIHVRKKKIQLDTKLRTMYWLIGKHSTLSKTNKLLIYKTIFKPIWMYGCQVWNSCSKTSLMAIESFQSKALRLALNAPWYMRNKQLRKEAEVPTVAEAIEEACAAYKIKLENHPNTLAKELLRHNKLSRFKKRRTIM